MNTTATYEAASATTKRVRVVVTGMGIVSCLGNDLDQVSAALRMGRGGIRRIDAWQERGFSTQVAGAASVSSEPSFDRKYARFMGETARFACHAAQHAITDARLDPLRLRSPDVGVVIGSGIGSIEPYDASMAAVQQRGIAKASPYTVPQAMSSTASASVAQVFGIEGSSYSPSSACTTSALAIGQAMQMIEGGRQQVVLAGGSEALHDNMTLMFDAMGILSRGSNERPERASRPYDIDRDGFVIASGAGVLVLESLDHALSRGARIYAELTGFGHCTDSTSMVSPGARGIARAIRAATEAAGVRPDYINTHAPSTPSGDLEELHALRQVFGAVDGLASTTDASGSALPPFSSTKGLTGHPLGACGAHEAIYVLLMMRDGFVAGSGVIASPEPLISGLPLIQRTQAARIRHAMSISFGFGGSCASLMFSAGESSWRRKTFSVLSA